MISEKNIIKSQRLGWLAEHVLVDEPMADVGTDHALLPISLVCRGVVPNAIAADLRPEPLEFARAHKRQYGLTDSQLDIRLGPGLAPLSPNEASTVVIAGMGGKSICEILNNHDPKALGIKRLLLQPTQGAPRLRRFLIEQKQWVVTHEYLLLEANRYYTNHIVDLTASSDQQHPTDDPMDWYVGYHNRLASTETFQTWCHAEKKRLSTLLQALEKASNDAVSHKKQDVIQKLEWLGKILN